ncbi:MAG: YARHG domain-containing protein [Lachnospiraceae bacterium]|nr:YARHG domain-containing protein [Lachnospiraceae bacterium]
MFCAKCGKQISDTTAFCPYCGQPAKDKPVNAAQQPAPGSAPMQPNPAPVQPTPAPIQPAPAPAQDAGSNKRLKVILFASIGSALVLAAAAAAVYFFFLRKPETKDTDPEEQVVQTESTMPEESPVPEEPVEEAEAEPFVEEPAGEEPAEEAVTDDGAADALLHFAQEQKPYINGLSGKFIARGTGYNLNRDYSKIPFGNIDCLVHDFDNDGTDELLIDRIDSNGWLTLTMYEYSDGRVREADVYEYDGSVIAADSGATFSFYYDYDAQTYICLYSEDYYYLVSDGLSLQFTDLVYDGSEFMIKGNAGYAGSDGMEDRNFVKSLRSNGINVDWETIMGSDIDRRLQSATDGHMLFRVEKRCDDPIYNEDYTINRVTGRISFNGYSMNSFTYGEAQPEDPEDEYIFPDSDIRLLTEADLAGYSKEELRLGRNEIVARHGRRFKDRDLQDYFDAQSWYVGIIDADDFNKTVKLSEIENKNMEFIMKHEK